MVSMQAGFVAIPFADLLDLGRARPHPVNIHSTRRSRAAT
jgi:hypothetical protein